MRSWLAVFAALILGSAQAQTPAPQEAAPAAPAPAEAPAETPAPAAAPAPAPAVEAKKLGDKQVPLLSIRWECGQCTQNEKVPPLVETAYATAATEQGYSVNGSETAEMVITAFRQRPPGLRVMFGAMAGKDVLNTKVSFRGKTFEVTDYMANAWVGMNGLSDAVGREALEKMLASMGLKQ
jgi:hypothetical protein